MTDADRSTDTNRKQFLADFFRGEGGGAYRRTYGRTYTDKEILKVQKKVRALKFSRKLWMYKNLCVDFY